MKIKLIFSLIYLILQSYSFCDTVELGWNQSPKTENIIGYKIYEGLESGNYDKTLDVGNKLTKNIEIKKGVQYYFAISSYDKARQESELSEELQVKSNILDISIFQGKYFISQGNTYIFLTIGKSGGFSGFIYNIIRNSKAIFYGVLNKNGVRIVPINYMGKIVYVKIVVDPNTLKTNIILYIPNPYQQYIYNLNRICN